MTTKSITSIGQLCQWLQHSPTEIQAAAIAVDVHPDVLINNITYYDDRDVPKIREQLERKK